MQTTMRECTEIDRRYVPTSPKEIIYGKIKTIYLHIGTHKTGTTSIQNYLQDNIELLPASGIDFYQGFYIDNNHVEINLAALKMNA